jgi:hypothetical protein
VGIVKSNDADEDRGKGKDESEGEDRGGVSSKYLLSSDKPISV